MTSLYQIDTGNKVYLVTDDFTSVYRALITGVVTDESSGLPLSVPDLKIQPDRPDLAVRTTNGGAFAVTGFSEQAFPKLSSTGYTVNLTVTASGFHDFNLAVPIAANAVFPVPAQMIAMRRIPVRLQGRVVSDGVNRAPIPGAKIVSVDDPSGPPPAVHALALRSPLYLAHPAGTTVRTIGMSSFGSAQLTADALAGTKTLALSTRAGLAVNSVIQLANSSGTNVAYGIVVSPGMGSESGTILLRDSLNTSFFGGISTAVQFLNPGAPGAGGTLVQDADARDGVLLSSALLTADTVEIDFGTASVEYHEVGALAGADGYYSINGLGRSQEVFLQVSHSGFSTQVQPWVVEYDNAVNVLDFRL